MNRHDINNYLGAIKGSLALALDKIGDKESVAHRLIANAVSASGHLQEAVDAVLPSQAKSAAPNERAAIVDGHNQSELFFTAIEMTRMPMIITDPRQKDNPIIFVNHAFLQTTGYAKEEMIGQNCRFLQGPKTDPAAVAEVRRAIEKRSDVAIEILNYRKDGTSFWNALFISPIFDANGDILYFFGSQLDVTRRHEAEAALRQTQKLEAIGQLTGGIAHDFNNLLQIVIGNLHLAQDQADLARRAELTDIALQASLRARTLTQQLLAFSRKQALETRTVSLNRIIGELIPLVSETLGETITTETALAETLGNIQIDTVHLEMAIINILANARDAMPGGGKVTLSTREHRQQDGLTAGDIPGGEYAVLSIADTGGGMPSEILAHVAEPFFTTKEVGKGTGLGLAQVHGFVKQSNGHVRMRSTVGVGTTIDLYFPLANEGERPSPASAGIEVASLQGRGERILIVEDNREVQDLAVNILEGRGYAVVRAGSAAEAMAAIGAEEKPFDLVFSDIIMPGSMNGVSLAREVRQRFPSMPILLTTGFSDDTNTTSLQGSFEVLYKPYMPRELAEKVRSTLNTHRNHGN